MSPNEKNNTTIPNQTKYDPNFSTKECYDDAKRNWILLCTENDLRMMTVRALFTAIRLSISEELEPEEVADLKWITWMGVYLSDVGCYEPI